MKTTSLLILLLLLIPRPARAQLALPSIYSPTALAYTNAIPDNSTNAISSTNLDCRRYDEFGLEIKFQMANAASLGIATFYCKTSLTTNNWPDHYSHVFQVAGNGTTYVVTNLNIHVGTMGYWRLDHAGVSTNGWALTNLAINYTPKPYRREGL